MTAPTLQKALARQKQALTELTNALEGAQKGLSYLHVLKRRVDSVVLVDTVSELQGIFASAVRENRWPFDCEVILKHRPAVFPGEDNYSAIQVNGNYVGSVGSIHLPQPLTDEMIRIIKVALETAEDLTPYVGSDTSYRLTP